MQLSVVNDPRMFSWDRGSFRVWRGAMTFTAEASRTVRAAQGLGWAPVPLRPLCAWVSPALWLLLP